VASAKNAAMKFAQHLPNWVKVAGWFSTTHLPITPSPHHPTTHFSSFSTEPSNVVAVFF